MTVPVHIPAAAFQGWPGHRATEEERRSSTRLRAENELAQARFDARHKERIWDLRVKQADIELQAAWDRLLKAEAAIDELDNK